MKNNKSNKTTKAYKAKKARLKPETKQLIKNYFGGLFKNDVAIEAAKESKWWLPVVLSLVAVFIPVIPLMVGVGNTYGSQFVSQKSYNLETYNTSAAIEIVEKEYSFKVEEDNLLHFYEKGNERNDWANADAEKPIASYQNTLTGNIEFQVYYANESTKAAQIRIETLNATKYVVGTQTKAEEANIETGDTVSYYTPSYLFIYKDGMFLNITKVGTTEKVASQAGDWKHTKAGTDIFSRVLEGNTYNYEKDTDGHYLALRNNELTTNVQKAWNSIYDEAYLTAKRQTFLTYTFVFFGTYAGLTLFMGLLIYLLTRGKNNPMNYLKFWTCEKITMVSSIAPGLLAMVFGFMFNSYATMFFIIFLGLRTMWISMKQLRPVVQ